MIKDKKESTLIRNTLIFALGEFTTKVLSFFLVPIYTAELSTFDYGNVDLIVTLTTVIIYIITLDIADAVYKFTITEKNKSVIFNNGLFITLLGNLFLLLIVILSAKFNILNFDRYLYLYLYLYTLIISIYNLINSYLLGLEKTKKSALMAVISAMITIVLNIIFIVYFKMKIHGYFISLIFSHFISCIFGIYFIIKKKYLDILDINIKKINSSIRKMIIYSIPLIFNGIIWWANSSINKFMIVYYDGVEENGVFSISYKISSMLSLVVAVFLKAWSLSSIKEYDKNDKDGFISKTYNYFISVMMIVSSLLIILNIPLSKILFSGDFFVAWKSSSILILSALFNNIASFLGAFFSASNNTKDYAISSIFSIVSNVLLNTILIPKFGIIGAAASTTISFFVMLISRYIKSKKYVKLNDNNKKNVFAIILLIIQVVIEHIYDYNLLYLMMPFIIIVFIYLKDIIRLIKDVYAILTHILIKKDENHTLC